MFYEETSLEQDRASVPGKCSAPSAWLSLSRARSPTSRDLRRAAWAPPTPTTAGPSHGLPLHCCCCCCALLLAVLRCFFFEQTSPDHKLNPSKPTTSLHVCLSRPATTYTFVHILLVDAWGVGTRESNPLAPYLEVLCCPAAAGVLFVDRKHDLSLCGCCWVERAFVPPSFFCSAERAMCVAVLFLALLQFA